MSKSTFPSSFKPIQVHNLFDSDEGYLTKQVLLGHRSAPKLAKAMRELHYCYRQQLSRSCKRVIQFANQQAKNEELSAVELNRLQVETRALLLTHIHSANCPPCGFDVEPRLFICRNHRICPFCFVRYRVLLIYSRILALDQTVLDRSRIAFWSQRLDLDLNAPSLPFFNRQTGPHFWFKSHFTAQVVVPFTRTVTLASPYVTKRGRVIDKKGVPVLYHVGIQVIPAEIDPVAVLAKRRPGFTVKGSFSLAGKSQIQQKKTVARGLSCVLALDWKELFSPHSTYVFSQLMSLFPNQNLIRFQQLK